MLLAEYRYPAWFEDLLGRMLPAECECIQIHGMNFRMIEVSVCQQR